MSREDLILPDCYIFTAHEKTDPVLGKTFYVYDEYTATKLKTVFLQHFVIEMIRKNVLRGFYIQDVPLNHEILMTCDHGSVQVTLLDLRTDSKTYLKHVTVKLSQSDMKHLYFPGGVAYAVLSLEDYSNLYCMSNQLIVSSMNRIINVFDPQLNCLWPDNVVMSVLERTAPALDELPHNYW